jgi:hypothetical protein
MILVGRGPGPPDGLVGRQANGGTALTKMTVNSSASARILEETCAGAESVMSASTRQQSNTQSVGIDSILKPPRVHVSSRYKRIVNTFV